MPLNEPADPIPSRRTVRLFGRHLPSAMLLGLLVLVGVVALVVVVVAIG